MEPQKHIQQFSFELFPPKTPAAKERLDDTLSRLAPLEPDFFSVTFGAGGSTRELTQETVGDVQIKTDYPCAPHISCFGYSTEEMRRMVLDYMDAGINHLVVLRGDLPKGETNNGAFRYASDLVAFIRKETGDHFHIDVACYPEFHPEANNASEDLENFKRKVDAGANGAITQYFFNSDAYFRFIDDCEDIGITIPITPGIMPIINSTQLIRFSEMCGAEMPKWILKRLLDFGDDIESIKEFGIEVTINLCYELLANGAPGLHIYTLNKAEAVETIWRELDI